MMKLLLNVLGNLVFCPSQFFCLGNVSFRPSQFFCSLPLYTQPQPQPPLLPYFSLHHFFFDYSTMDTRVALPDREQRQYLRNFAYTEQKMSMQEVAELLQVLPREIRDVVKWAVDFFGLRKSQSETKNVPVTLPRGTRAFFRCLSSESPVCHYVVPSEDNLILMSELTNKDIKAHQSTYADLQKECPIIFQLLEELDDCVKLPSEFRRLLTYLSIKAQEPFNPDYRLPDLPPVDDKRLER